MPRVIVGTAGHIDHGKSTLVRALTGTDPDRLPEEKRRGITVDLGFAFFGDVAAIIDVPGHERLIHNMVAGAATIDFALLVVAADDGVMPQTTEHLQILQLLGVRRGAAVITKCDTVEADWLELIVDQVRTACTNTFLNDAPLFRVDAVTGRGMSELAASLTAILTELPPREDRGVFRMPIDRVFAVKGRGTVVTGTVLAGTVKKDARLAALPGNLSMRVKRVESHGHEVEEAQAGQRAALNLIGSTESLIRGLTLTTPGGLVASSRLLVVTELLPSAPPLKDRQRVRFLIGTQEVMGRVVLLDKSNPAARGYAHVLLESEVTAAWGDRFILRRYSPLETLGGGTVLDPRPPALRARSVESELQAARSLDTLGMNAAIAAYLQSRAIHGAPLEIMAALFGISAADLSARCRALPPPADVHEVGGFLISRTHMDGHDHNVRTRLAELHERSPDSIGFSRAELLAAAAPGLPDVLFEWIIGDLTARGLIEQEGGLYREPQRKMKVSEAQAALMDKVAEALSASVFSPPSAAVLAESLKRPVAEIEKTLVLLERAGRARRLGTDMFFTVERFDAAVETTRRFFVNESELTVAGASQLLASSRKYVVPFLEYLDSVGVTLRSGNVRVPGPKCRRDASVNGDASSS